MGLFYQAWGCRVDSSEVNTYDPARYWLRPSYTPATVLIMQEWGDTPQNSGWRTSGAS